MMMLENHLGFNYVCLNHEDKENADFWAKLCDGFVIAGGVDIHPSIYDENVVGKSNLSKFDIARDFRELAVIDFAVKNKKPMFAICRGHQLLSVYLGLQNHFSMDLNECHTVHQPSARGITPSELDVIHSVQIIEPELFPMPVAKERATLFDVLNEREKTDKIWVNSFHHQGILFSEKFRQEKQYANRGITVIGVALADWDTKKPNRIIELMCGENWVSCQWHPEYDYEYNTPSQTVIDMFVNFLNR